MYIYVCSLFIIFIIKFFIIFAIKFKYAENECRILSRLSKKKRKNKIKKTAKSSTERVREFRARRKAILNVENDSSNDDSVQNSESDHNDIPMDVSNVQGDENDIVNNDCDVDSSDNLSLYCDDKELTSVPRSTDTKEVHVDTTSSTGGKGITVLHKGFHCHVCTGQITGFRYTCVECSDFDMCRSCEAEGRHDQHYVLRIAPDRPAAEFGAVLGGIRSLLMTELDPLATEQQSQQPQDISIKFENAADDQFEVDEEAPTASKPRDDSNQEYGQADEVDGTPIIITIKEELERECLEVQHELGDVAMARTDLACKPMILINAGRIMNKPCDVSSCSRAPDSRPSNDAPETTIPVKKVRLKCRELDRLETGHKHESNDTVDTSTGNDTDVSLQSSSDFIISDTISIVADTSNR